MTEVWSRARRLARRVGGIRDLSLRIRYLRYLARESAPEEVAEILGLAVHLTEAREHRFGGLALGLCVALADEDMDEVRAAVAQAAMLGGDYGTAALLSPRPPLQQPDDPPEVPDFGTGRVPSLGERKSLARRRDRDLLARVLSDPHPAVIRILLSNPALTEPDVVRLCARRPIGAAVLREVFRSPRWVTRYAVRRAIVKNPFTPQDIALQLCAHLTATDAVLVARSPELGDAVRDACRRVGGLATVH
ncbi:MAG: hypothetical protein ACFCGT_15350 [Sandaracinaceae bacterium]